MKRNAFCLFLVGLSAVCMPPSLFGGGKLKTNPPGCDPTQEDCGCSCEQVSADCIKVNIGLGETTPWTGSLGCSLKIFADDDSPSIFTPESLHAVLGGYTFKRLGQKTMADGVTPAEVVLSHPNGEAVHFVFANGESLGRPDPGVHIKMDARLQMVDSEGWATTHDPVYYDLYVGDGTKRRFLATNMTGALGALVSITDERGVVRTPADMGVDIIYDPDGVRQYLTPSRLANVTRTADFLGYDVAIYAIQEPPQKDAATGMYPVPAGQTVEHVSVRRENGGKRAVVTIRKGGGEPLRYVFDYAMNEWSLTRPSGMQERKECIIADGRAAQITKTDVSSSGEVLAKKVKNYKWMSWGFAMTNRVEGFDGVTDTTTWTYYTSGNGKGQVKTEKRQSGLLIQYAYDNLDRIISKTRSGPDMMTELTTYDYTPVDANDPVLPVDTRPRTVVRKLNNIECERTYYVYSPLTHVVERVGTQGAAYGGTNVLRTVAACYPVVVNDPRSGFVQSIRHEDGRLDLYDYELSSNIWVRTVTHLHEQSPLPVSGKTTRDITTTNRRGEILEQKTDAYIDGIWYTIARNRMTYNFEGKRITSENLAGQVTTTAWDCCHKVSEVQPDGSTTTWDYDVEGRMIASSRLIPLDMTNVTWLTTCYRYDDLGRQVATWQTNYAAQVGLPATRTRYDGLGRVIARVDTLGNTTTMTYGPDGRTESVSNPNTSTSVIASNAGGDMISRTGSFVSPEFLAYGVLSNGIRWTKNVHGDTAMAPRFSKRYENLLSQTIKEEQSGFKGSILSKMHIYDCYDCNVLTVSDGEPLVEYSYDSLGNPIAVTRKVFANGLTGLNEWRKVESSASFFAEDGVVWLVKTNVVSCSDTSIPPLVTVDASQLSGLLASNPLHSYYIDARGNVAENELFVGASLSISRYTVPYATVKSLSMSRYGVVVMDVSISSVTNTYVYDALGRQIARTDGCGNTHSLEYNAVGQLAASINARGNRTAYAYDRFGNLSAVTNPLGQVTVYEYDLRGRKTYECGAAYPVRYAYDMFDNMIMMETYSGEPFDLGTGDVTTWLYDEASGCMTNKIYADGKGPKYSYTPGGVLSRRIWERGVVTDYSYDCWGSITNVCYSDGTPSVTFVYDAIGREAEIHDAAGMTRHHYDSYGALDSEIVIGTGGTNTILRYWDNYGRSLGYALNGARLTTIAYDPESARICSMAVGGCDTPFVWSYVEGADNVEALSYPNGIISSFKFNPEYQLSACHNSTLTNVISEYNYAYDFTGNRIGATNIGVAHEHDGAVGYFYNERNELTNAVFNGGLDCFCAYSYDAIGNRISSLIGGRQVVYESDSINKYTAVDGFVPLYDDDGNQTLVKTYTGTWQVSYNAENRPVLWTRVSDNMTVSMVYDRLGRRVAKGNLSFVYDGYHQIADSAGNCYVWDAATSGASKILMRMNSGEFVYYCYAGDRDVIHLVLNDGSLVANYLYDPYGNPIVSEGALADENKFRFSCGYADDELGLLYYNYRHYDPSWGRWLVRDPIDEWGGINLYCSFWNNPILNFDRLGLEPSAAHSECEKQKNAWEGLFNNSGSAIRRKWDEMAKGKKCSPPPVRCGCCTGDHKNSNGYWSYKEGVITICENNLPAKGAWSAFGRLMMHELVHAAQRLCYEWKDGDCRNHVCREIQAYLNEHSSLGKSVVPRTRKRVLAGVKHSSFCKCAREVLKGSWDDKKSCKDNAKGKEEAVRKRIEAEFNAIYDVCSRGYSKPANYPSAKPQK